MLIIYKGRLRNSLTLARSKEILTGSEVYFQFHQISQIASQMCQPYQPMIQMSEHLAQFSVALATKVQKIYLSNPNWSLYLRKKFLIVGNALLHKQSFHVSYITLIMVLMINLLFFSFYSRIINLSNALTAYLDTSQSFKY